MLDPAFLARLCGITPPHLRVGRLCGQKLKRTIMEYVIEKDIKLPETLNRKGRNPKYPFREMEVGDSFVCGNYSRKNMTKMLNVGRAWACRVDRSIRFRIRKLSDGKMRIWRVS